MSNRSSCRKRSSWRPKPKAIALPASPPEGSQMFRARGQAAMEVEAPGRAARAFPLALPAGDQDDRAVVALDEPRGDDADHALVPLLAREHVAALPLLRLRPSLDL